MKRIVLLFVLALFACACNKTLNPEPEGEKEPMKDQPLRIKKVELIRPDYESSSTSLEFFYDSNSRVNKMISKEGGTTTISYNYGADSGTYIIYYDEDDYEEKETYTFDLNKDGYITSKTGEYGDEIEYTYAGDYLVSSISKWESTEIADFGGYVITGIGTYVDSYSFQWNNGNLVKASSLCEYTPPSNIDWESRSPESHQFSFEYSSEINPFRDGPVDPIWLSVKFEMWDYDGKDFLTLDGKSNENLMTKFDSHEVSYIKKEGQITDILVYDKNGMLTHDLKIYYQ